MSEIVQYFEQNTSGKDYVVGDIHGEFGMLNKRLVELKFNPETDRLFSVGDLVDRGPDSEACLQWLAQPWFHAILGNHEAMGIDSWKDQKALLMWQANGGDWWLKLNITNQKRYVDAFKALPFAMEIKVEGGRVGIVHADVPSGISWQNFLSGLIDDDEKLRNHALWSRRRATRQDDKAHTVVEGIDRVFCGHTPLQRPAKLGNICFIDTGACYPGGCLTVVLVELLV